MDTTDLLWRSRVSASCGGSQFDAHGAGYAFSDVLAEERQLAQANILGNPTSALLALSIADPTWKMPEVAMDAAMRYYTDCHDSTRYTDNRGIVIDGQDTHDLLADWLNARFGNGQTPFTRDMVQYSPGAIKRALAEFLPTLLFAPNNKLFFPTPGYPVIKSPMNARNIRVNDVALLCNDGRWEFDLEEMSQCCQCHIGIRVMYANMPHNPTGSGYSRDQWQALLKWAMAYNIVLVVDEAYTDLRYSDRTCSVLTIPGWEQSCIVMQSVSKGWSATGLRFGWMVGHPTIIKALRKITDVKDSGMFGPSIAAGLQCLQHPELAETTRKRYEQLHQKLFDGLRAAGFNTSMPEAGLCQFTPAPRATNGVEFTNAQECAQWFRQQLRISLMHYTVNGKPWLRWAVTLKPVVECGLNTEESVINEVVRRLQTVEFSF